jgi:hypothetical protein
MRCEVERAIAADVCYGPGVDTVRHLACLLTYLRPLLTS